MTDIPEIPEQKTDAAGPDVTVFVKQPKKEVVSKPKREMTEKQKQAFEKMRDGLARYRETMPDYSQRMKDLVAAEKQAIEQRIKAETSLPANAKVVVKSRRGRQPGTKFPGQGRKDVFTPAPTDIESEAEPEMPTMMSESSSEVSDHEAERVLARKERRARTPKVKAASVPDQMRPVYRPVNAMNAYLNSLNGRF